MSTVKITIYADWWGYAVMCYAFAAHIFNMWCVTVLQSLETRNIPFGQAHFYFRQYLCVTHAHNKHQRLPTRQSDSSIHNSAGEHLNK